MNLKIIDYMLKTDELKIHVISLPPRVYGFVYYSRKGRYHIFISEALSLQARQEVLRHEIHHIIVDMPKLTYFFGLDMQREPFEKSANSSQFLSERHFSNLMEWK